MAQSARMVTFFIMSSPMSRTPCHSTLDTRLSLDHLICPIQHRLWNRQTDLLRRFEIYHQLELRRLLYRQVRRLGSLQDSVHEICDAPVAVRQIGAIVHEKAGVNSVTGAV